MFCLGVKLGNDGPVSSIARNNSRHVTRHEGEGKLAEADLAHSRSALLVCHDRSDLEYFEHNRCHNERGYDLVADPGCFGAPDLVERKACVL